MKGLLTVSAALAATVLLVGTARAQQDIPLPEHPRPDFERAAWENLNGTWQFRFDAKDEGRRRPGRRARRPSRWPSPSPSPGDPSSPVSPTPRRSAGTRARSRCRRPGRGSASSWSSAPPTGTPRPGSTGTKLGEHQGGYTPFEFELTPHVRPGTRAAPHPARRRRGPRVQARRQAGLRQRARHLADAVPGGARQGGAGAPCISRPTSTRAR